MLKGFEPEARYDIRNAKGDKLGQLNDNISKQRDKQMALLPGFVSDLNEKIVYPQDKLYLR